MMRPGWLAVSLICGAAAAQTGSSGVEHFKLREDTLAIRGHAEAEKRTPAELRA